MDEIELIRSFAERFPRSPDQENLLFESDAEIFSLGNTKLAITTDEFCEEEDGFNRNAPETLGENLVAATISDLVAVGATPAFFLQVVCFPRAGGEEFGQALMTGVKRALEAAKVFLLGGDTSSGEHWRYVGTAIGTFPESKPLLRRTESDRLLLYATGNFGDGNLMALNDSFQAGFELRHDFMTRARPFLGLAMDSSDGLRNTLTTLAKVNENHRLIVEPSSVPVHPAVEAFCAKAGLPSRAFLLGSAGEYELVVGVHPERQKSFEAICKPEEVSKIGTIEKSDRPGVYWQVSSDEPPRTDLPIQRDPRFGHDREAYVSEIISIAKRLFG